MIPEQHSMSNSNRHSRTVCRTWVPCFRMGSMLRSCVHETRQLSWKSSNGKAKLDYRIFKLATADIARSAATIQNRVTILVSGSPLNTK